MASKTQEALLEHFRAVTGGPGTSVGATYRGRSLSDTPARSTIRSGPAAQDLFAAREMSLSSGPGEPSSPVRKALSYSTPIQPRSGVGSGSSSTPTQQSSSVGSTVLSIASKVFDSGLGLIPLIGGLFGLFGGGGPATPPPLVKYAMPERQYFTGADTGAGFSQADYDQMGMPRPYDAGTGGDSIQANPVSVPVGGGGSTGSGPVHQINVNVQTMDARSFLDHSNEIAQAVRQAMLSLSSINDVVSDL